MNLRNWLVKAKWLDRMDIGWLLLCAVVLVVGIEVGGLIEHARARRMAARRPLPEREAVLEHPHTFGPWNEAKPMPGGSVVDQDGTTRPIFYQLRMCSGCQLAEIRTFIPPR